MAEVANGGYWRVHQELLTLIGDLHQRGELSKTAYDELSTALLKGTYQAGVAYLMDAGIMPRTFDPFGSSS